LNVHTFQSILEAPLKSYFIICMNLIERTRDTNNNHQELDI
jgi:hypothetical protein